MGSPINFAEIARRFGGKSVLASHQTTQPTPQPQTLGSDYSEMARQFGGKTLIQRPPTAPDVRLPQGSEWDDPLTMAVGFGKGLLGIDQAPGVTPSGFGALFNAAIPALGGLKALKTMKAASAASDAVQFAQWLETPDRDAADKLRSVDHSSLQYTPPGRTYQVKINASPEEFLDLDKPLSEQSEAVRRSLEKLQEKYRKTQGESGPYLAPSATGKQALDEIINVADAGKRGSMTYKERQAAASSLLRKQGIKGVKYLDGASRSAGEGSRNYVVYDDALIDILKVGGMALPGLASLSYEAKKNGGMVDLSTVNDPKYWKKEPPK